MVKLADDLYCGGETINDLLLKPYSGCCEKKRTPFIPNKNYSIPAYCKYTWVWTERKISESQHSVAKLSSCSILNTVFGFRSSLEAYKFMGWVTPKYAEILSPLEDAISGKTI